MAGILIRNYTTTASTFNSDDYGDMDGATGGTRKMLLSVMATQFGLQLASDGMVFGAGSAAAPKLAVGTAGNGLYASATNTLDFSTNGTRVITVTSGQLVGVGVATPVTALHVGTSLTTSPRGIMTAQYSTSVDGARFHMRKARGTEAAPTTVVTGDVLGKLVATGYDGSNYLEMASISLEATGTVAATRIPTRMVFATATNAAPSVLTDRMWLTEAGDLGIGTSGPGKKLDINSATGACLQLTYNDPDGSAANKVTFDVSSTGNLTIAPSGGSFVLGNATLTSNALDFQTAGIVGSQNGADTRTLSLVSRGQIILTPNGAGTGGAKSIIGIGGVTSSQPGLKASSTTLAVRLADDSADTKLTCGALTASSTVIFSLSATPASAAASGTAGTISWDSSFIYVCTAANTWRRVAIATW